METIYFQNIIPDQWKIGKITPLLKKGFVNIVDNYKPIWNLSSVSKIYKKIILQRLMDNEKETKIDLTRDPQHGFKKTKSTATAGLVLQSIIANHLDINDHALMASLNLTEAFNNVNVDLLMKRLSSVELPRYTI